MTLSLENKLDYAAADARLKVAEQHFFDLNQPFFPMGFSVVNRNPGHWDISAPACPGKVAAWKSVNPDGRTTEADGGRERAFIIRGEPGNVSVTDERWDPHRPFPRASLKFRSVTAAMLWIVEELMQEPVVTSGKVTV